ncbi:MAG: hypothetical protein COB98_04525 [Flavobacteriaceae bacterium]|nr:MAG: hypothetical protein COB98_04525 [Flavobacteriaceae bacterium]
MAGILDLLNSDLGKSLISGASSYLGQGKEQTGSGLSAALPLILGALKNNTATSGGAEGLLGALSKDKHDGSILDNLGDMLGKEDTLKDGANILGHVFGGKEQSVAQAVSAKSGLDLGKSMDLLKMAAPVIMGLLGKQSRQNNVADGGGLDNLLGGLLGGGNQAKEGQSLITKILDANGDGSIIDDVMGMVTGSNKGGLGSILGGLFGGK